MSSSLQPHGLQPARLLWQWDSLGKNIGVNCHSLLQGIFLFQGLNQGLLRCRQILYHLRPQESPNTCMNVNKSDTFSVFPFVIGTGQAHLTRLSGKLHRTVGMEHKGLRHSLWAQEFKKSMPSINK